MKRLAIAAVAMTVLSVLPAFAADLALEAPPPAVAVGNWTRFYAGVVAGGGFAQDSTSFVFAGIPGNPNAPANVSPNGSGGLVGAELGYNYQIGNFLAGIEADIDYARISGNGTSITANGFAMATTQQSMNSIGTVRGRVGFWAPGIS
jgi:outer membrane immunogenic protein